MTILIAIFAIMSSCTNYPKCGQEDAIKLALEVCIKEVKYELAYKKFYKEEIDKIENSYLGQQSMEMLALFSMMSGGGSQDIKKSIEKTKKEAEREIRNIIEGESYKKDKYLKYVRHADSLVNISNIELINIRTTKIDKELKKCDCKADFVITGAIENEGVTINYTAQFTDDDTLFVEVEI